MTDHLLPQFKNNDDFHIKYKMHKNPIGRGSFSTVYLGTDRYNNLVAIKQISLTKIKSSYTDKFFRELDISIKLDHPNIVKCYEVFKTEKYWYIVNEYCDCGTLQDLIPDLSKYNQQQRECVVKKILNELKEALKYLINNNIIHRDLKPSNILIKKISTDNYLIKLADFGFARYFSNEITDEGTDDMVNTICGSPIYMAPELLINLKYNMKADLWSFGVIMYELLYGINPYCFPKNIPELRKLMVEKQIVYDNIFSSDCINLLKSLLTTDPEKRINWKNFFLHPWFNSRTVPNKEKNDPLIKINPETKIELNIQNNIKISEHKKDNFKKSQILDNLVALEIKSSGAVINKELSQSVKSDDQDFKDIDLEFEMINNDEFDNKIPEYNSYESSTGSLIKILSNSIKNIWNYNGSYGNSYSSSCPSGYNSLNNSPNYNSTNYNSLNYSSDNYNPTICCSPNNKLPYGKSLPINIKSPNKHTRN